jgi:hypothetical protein
LEAAAVASKNILKFDGKFHSMKKWVIKAIVQKIISFLPYKYQINYLFQKYITRGVQLSDDYLEDRLIHYANHQKAFLSFEKKLEGKKIGELGTGWYPVIPICFYLNGASEIVTMDIAPLMDKEKAVQTILKLQHYAKRDRLRDFITYSEEKLDELVDFVQNTSFSFEELLQKMKITYRLGDAAQMDLKRASYDLIVSNNTFEHVYPDDLKTLLQKFKKLLKPGGVMSHFIDMSDHFAHWIRPLPFTIFSVFPNHNGPGSIIPSSRRIAGGSISIANCTNNWAFLSNRKSIALETWRTCDPYNWQMIF